MDRGERPHPAHSAGTRPRNLPHPAALLICLALATPLHAARLTGLVVEKDKATALADVEIVARRADDTTFVAHTTTGHDGRFTLDSLRAGTYSLRALLLGHEPWHRAGVLLDDTHPALDLGTIPLAVSAIGVKGVETSTGRATAIVQSDRNVYLAKDLPAAGSGTATEVLRQIPELDVDINDHVSIRGSGSVTIQFNGRNSPLKGEALVSFLKQYPAARIERVEVLANPSAKYDPEGTGGILNIVTKEPLDMGTSGSAWLSWGDRSQGVSPRIAWQRGRLTLYGGASGFWNRITSGYSSTRTTFSSDPPRTLRDVGTTPYRSGYGGGDGSFDFAFDKRNTLYGTLNANFSASRYDETSTYSLSDPVNGETTRYRQDSDGRSDWRQGSATLGFQHVVEASRNEWSAELLHNVTPYRSRSNTATRYFVPVDSTGDRARYDSDSDNLENSLQIDVTRPLGRKGKLETGYRGLRRRDAASSELAFDSGRPGPTPGDYVHEETFHSAYLTVGTTVGRLSSQLGVRGELAKTWFEVLRTGTRYPSDYRSAYPSANVAWDFGKGRTTRLTYSRRVERPSAYLLNPDVPAVDSLNRFSGNPSLAPKYTDSWSLDLSWSGSRGLARLSPYFRDTRHNWDSFKTVDSTGVATSTYRNAAAIRYYGVTLLGSLRQTGRVGGSLTLSVFREDHDASNVAATARRHATNWSASGNGTVMITKPLSVEAWLQFRPAQTLAQGRSVATLYSSLGLRYKLGAKAWLSFSDNDPFGLWRSKTETGDATFAQSTSNSSSMRRVALSLGWSWGKPPQTKPRKQSGDSSAPDATGAGK